MQQRKTEQPFGAKMICFLVLSWLLSVSIEFILNPGSLIDLSILTKMSIIRVISVTAILIVIFYILSKRLPSSVYRWMILGVMVLLCALTVITSYTPAFCQACIIVVFITLIYAIKGWDQTSLPEAYADRRSKLCVWITAGIAVVFFVFVSVWTVCRVKTFSTPTYDFGIFSQMFYNMKKTGLPLTTVERDGLLSHFKVHVSPIYYLLLPFYCIAPTASTLQVLQAAVLASAVIPVWLLCQKHGLSPVVRVLLILTLCLYPAYSGGTSYDIHENAFLTPLILWLFYAIDTKNNLLIGIFTVLTLMVKEDAAVYTAIIGLFLIVHGLIRIKGRHSTITGAIILIFSIIWFLTVTGYLSKSGDGVMTYRYDNFIYDGSGSLFTVIKAVIMCPMKALYECTDNEKIEFILYTALPLLCIPIITRRYERFILLIPYFLVNLMSDYQYQHSIFFQYTFGSTAFLFYLVIVNLADIKGKHLKLSLCTAAAIISLFCFVETVLPVAVQYPRRYQENKGVYQATQEVLDTIPEGASVAATTFYTTPLSQRSNLYDIQYTTTDTVINCEYVVLAFNNKSSYKKYETVTTDGLNSLITVLLENGFTLESELEGVVQIYRK